MKTQYVTKSRGRHCGDVEMAAYLEVSRRLQSVSYNRRFSSRLQSVSYNPYTRAGVCGDIELADYLTNVGGSVSSLVVDLHITHDRFGSDPSINGHLYYPNDVDRSLNETPTD